MCGPIESSVVGHHSQLNSQLKRRFASVILQPPRRTRALGLGM